MIPVLELTIIHKFQRIRMGIRKFTHFCKLWVGTHPEQSGCHLCAG